MWTKELFGTDKPIIALLHLDALPGEPGFGGSLDVIMEHAAADLAALQDGGVDGVLIANEYCFPITPNTSTVTLMAMASVIGSLKKDTSNIRWATRRSSFCVSSTRKGMCGWEARPRRKS